jgi:hypothetical protein
VLLWSYYGVIMESAIQENFLELNVLLCHLIVSL